MPAGIRSASARSARPLSVSARARLRWSFGSRSRRSSPAASSRLSSGESVPGSSCRRPGEVLDRQRPVLPEGEHHQVLRMGQAQRLEHRPVDGDDVAGGDREGEADLPLQGQHVLGLGCGRFDGRHALSIEPGVAQRLGHQSARRGGRLGTGPRRPVRSARGTAVAGRGPAADLARLADRLRAAAPGARRAAAARRRHQPRGLRRPGDAVGVARARSRRMSDLARRANQSQSRLSHTVARLEDRGWVRRERSADDGRGNLAVLTDAGWDIVRRWRPATSTPSGRRCSTRSPPSRPGPSARPCRRSSSGWTPTAACASSRLRRRRAAASRAQRPRWR